MIRAAALVAVLAGPAGADGLVPPDCGKVLDRLTGLVSGIAPLSATIVPTNRTGCLYGDLRLDLPGQYMPDWHVEALYLEGALDWLGGEALPPDRLYVSVTGLRMVVQTGYPQTDYLFAAQSRVNLIDGDLALAWDRVARVLTLERLEIDFPGENRISLTAKVAGVDLASTGAMQMSATSFALTEADLAVQTHGLFEWYGLMVLGPALLPVEGDMEAAAEALRGEAIAGIEALPDAMVSKASKAALAALVRDLPNPAGDLAVAFRADPGFGPTRFAGFAMTGVPRTLAEAAPVLDGVTLDIGWTPSDAP